MSVQTEITRIESAKTAIATAIAGKGVTVPDGTLLDGMAALIESIEADLEYNRLKKVAGGTFTVTERTQISSDNRFIFEHNSGVVPFLFIITASTTSSAHDLNFIVTFRIPNANAYTNSLVVSFSSRRASSSTTYYASHSTELGSIIASSWDTQYVSIVDYKVNNYLNTGITYTWAAYYIE